jgi:hypothetical protein
LMREYYPLRWGYFVPCDSLDFFMGYVLPYMIDPAFAVQRFIGGPLLSMVVVQSQKMNWEFLEVLRVCQAAFALLIE